MRRADRRVVLGLHRTRPRRELLDRALTAGITELDTAFNYQGFDGHRLLARAAGNLIGEFEVSTKVGFFPSGNTVHHSLRPMWLLDAVQRSVEDLGVQPAVVFLHSPERSLRELPRQQGYDLLSAASAVLGEAVTAGLCGAWGIASWEPAPVLRVLRTRSGCPTPDVVMARGGLTLSADQLRDAEELYGLLGTEDANKWGMSPFAGSTSDPAWANTDLSAFLEPGQEHTSVQAAFRLAYELPEVRRIAVGTDDVDHLHELTDAAAFQIADGAIARYRELIEDAEVAEAGRG